MTEFLIGVGIYLLGVVVAIIINAYINAKTPNTPDDMPLWATGFSWLFVLAILLVLACYPLKMLYDFMYKVFKE